MTEVVGEAVVELRGDKSRLVRDMKGAGKTSGGVFSRAFGSATAKLGALAGGAAVAGFVGQSVKLEAAFSKTLNVMQETSGATAAEMEDLRDLAKQMGADTVFSAKDAADAMLELARGGITPAKIEAGALEAAMTLAAAGELEMGDAANTVVQAMGAFSLEAEDAASAAAALSGGANASSASVDDMRQALAQAGSGAAAAGLSIQETTAALAAFSNAGIQGSDAGTSLKTFLTRLVPMSDKAAGAMNSLGLISVNAARAQEVLAEEGIKNVKNFSDVGAITTATEAHFAHALGVEKDSKAAKEAAKQFLTNTQVMDSAFLDAKGNFEDLDTIAGALQKSLKGLSDQERTKALNTIFGADATRAANILAKEGAEGLQELTKQTSDAGAAQRQAEANMKGTAGVLEALSGSWETLVLQVGEFIAPAVQQGLTAITEVINGIVPTVTAIADSFTGAGDSAGSLTSKVAPAFEAIGEFMASLLPTIKQIGSDLLGVLGPGIAQIADLFTSKFLPAFQDLLPIVQPIAKFLLQMFGEALVGAIRGAIQAVKGIIQVITGVIDVVVGVLTGDWARAWDGLKGIVGGAINAIVGLLRVWWNLGILQLFRKGILFLTKGLWTGLWTFLKNSAGKGMNLVTGLISKGLNAVRDFFIKGVKAYVGLWTGLFKFLWGIASNAFKVLRSAFGGFSAAVRGIISGLASGIRNVVSGIAGFVIGAIKAIPGKIAALAGRFASVGKQIINAFVDGLKGAGGVISGIAGNVWTALRGMLNVAIDKINSALEFKAGPITVNPPDIPKLARGTQWFSGGQAWVGEQGPELVNLPRGSEVIPAGKSKQMAAGGGITVINNYPAPEKPSTAVARLNSIGYLLGT